MDNSHTIKLTCPQNQFLNILTSPKESLTYLQSLPFPTPLVANRSSDSCLYRCYRLNCAP